jgi:coenzyme Q-binding protein COQ10
LASAETTAVFDCTPDQFFRIISDYAQYPTFLNEVKDCQVLKTEGQRKLVEYKVSVIKTFAYRLWMVEEAGRKITWSLDSGDIFKTSNGLWELSEAPGHKTTARYWVEATFSLFVPGPITKALVNANLPGMVAAYKKRVKELYGG